LNSGYYTPESLFSYLNRVDIYQAIAPAEAAIILKDYIRMCNDLGVEPDTNTNSLKREHDVAIRNYHQARSRVDEEKFKEVAKKLKKFEFSSKRYSIIAPEKASDIIEEGRMQRNCVGCYVRSVIDGSSVVLFLRKNDSLDRSYVTIEIDPKDYHIRQKYLSCNRHITDKNVLNFLDKWDKELLQTIEK
jgi:hypothetical protein